MSRSPLQEIGSRGYKEGWRAVNELIRGGGSWSGRERNVCFRNQSGGRFEEVSYVQGLDFPGDGRGLAVLDFDNDGRQDLALSFRTAPRLLLLRNQTANGRALRLELRGVRSNRDAVGAWVTLVTSARKLERFVRAGSGFLSQSSRRLHFGLNSDEQVIRLEVAWPSGGKDSITNPAQEGLWRLVEGGPLEKFEPRRSRLDAAPSPEAESLWLREPLPLPAEPTLRGAWTLLSFYADWCPPCRQEMADWKPHGLPLTVLDVDKAPMESWNAFRRELFDYREDLALPTSFLLDERGRLVKVYRGTASAERILADMRPGAPRPSLPFAGSWLEQPGRRNFAAMATALAEAGLIPEAERYFALAQPDEETRVNYAASLLARGERERAAALLEKVLASSPSNVDALANLGLALLGLERFGPAVASLEQLTRLQPDDAAAHEWLAMARMGEGNAPAAIGSFERARRLGRDGAELLNYLGILYAQSGEREKALIIFGLGVEKFPAHAGLRANIERLRRQ